MKKRNRRRNASRSHRARRTQFEALEQRCVLSATPMLAPIADITLNEGAPINLALDAIYDLDGPLTYTVECSDPNVNVYVPEGNRSMRISVSAENGAISGDMIFELFEGRAPRVTNQIISLAEDGFYDGIIFHRIIDNFMIQGGDPTGTGSGGSYLGDFDDQFNTELMHTTTGVLSMAKTDDDTNDSQFFITEGATRYLDFQHSIFGQLVEGEDIREALSEIPTDTTINSDPDKETDDRPLNMVTMESVEIFEDNENAILVINAPHDYTGSSSVTITVTIHDQAGNEYVQTPINVTIQDDLYYNIQAGEWLEENSNPFLSDLPTMRTEVDTPYTIDLSQYIQDVENFDDGNSPAFLNANRLYYYEETIPYGESEALGHSLGFDGLASFEPVGGIVGTYPFQVSMGVWTGYLDQQVAALNIVPNDAPDATIEMTLVTEPTTVDAQGEVDSLPADAEWVNAWEECSIEVWAKIDDAGQFGIYSVETDLNFDPDQYQVTNIDWGVGFSQEQTGTIDNATGTITGLGGTTKWYSVIPYYETVGYAEDPDTAYPSSGAEDLIMWGDDRYVLVARVDFQPVATGETMTVKSGVGYNDATAASFGLSQGDVKWNAVDGTDVTVDTTVDTEIWAIPYDLDGNGEINMMDFGQFIVIYGQELDTEWGYACDFNRDGAINMMDLSEMLVRFYYRADSSSPIELPDYYPLSTPAVQSASLMGTQSASLMGTLTASDLASYFGEDDKNDDEDEASAVDLIMAMYADAE